VNYLSIFNQNNFYIFLTLRGTKMLNTEEKKISRRKTKMKVIISFLMIGLTILAIPTKSYAQGEAAVPFLLLAPDSRFGALGESGTGLADNSAAIFWNPAGIAFLRVQKLQSLTVTGCHNLI
jgi:hypothetical protein